MEKRKVDVVVIGSGTAGVVAYAMAKRNGAKNIVMVEDGPYGTMCARVGCMPSKALIAAAHAAHEMRTASQFGVYGQPEIRGSEVLSIVREKRTYLSGHEVKRIERMPETHKVRGTASFLSPTLLKVENRETGEVIHLQTKATVIATGSYQWVPEVLKAAGDRLIDNVALFNLEDLPKSVAVIGTGVIGLELGQSLHRLGVKTSFYSLLDQLASATDPAIQSKMKEIFGAELDLHLPVEITHVQRDGDEVVLFWKDREGQRFSERFEYLFVATGRRPKLAPLHLEATGIALKPNGVPEFNADTMQCGDAPIFIAGDATGEKLLQHEAAGEGRAAGTNAATYPEVKPMPHRVPLSIVFTDPQLSIVGESYAALKAKGIDFGVGQADLDKQTRLYVSGKAKGLLRIYGERGTGKLLGAEILGPEAEHLGHLLNWAIQLGVHVKQALGLTFYHPVLEEAVRTALSSLRRDL